MAADQDNKARHICVYCGKRRYEKFMTYAKIDSKYLSYEYKLGSWVCCKTGRVIEDSCAVKWISDLQKGVKQILEKLAKIKE